VTRETSFLPFLQYLWCVAQRSLNAVTKVYYRSMSWFATVSPIKCPTCSPKVSLTKGPSGAMWVRHSTNYVTKYDAIPHSTEQDTLPIVFLISKQVVPYRTCGGKCCPEVSTPKIQSLIDSSTISVIPRSEIVGTKLPYVCPGCSNHTYSNNMITRFHVQ
jgi:hypothetical protein